MSSPLRRTARSASTATKRLLDTTKREINKLKDTAAGRGRATSQALLRQLKQLKGGKSNLAEMARKVLLPHIPVLQKKYPESSQEVSRRVRTEASLVASNSPAKQRPSDVLFLAFSPAVVANHQVEYATEDPPIERFFCWK